MCSSINLSAALSKADTDRDGSLTEEELSQALKHIVKEVDTEDAAAALIRRLDRDHDGEVSLSALERYLDRYAERLAKAEAQAVEEDSGAPLPAGAATTPGKAGSKAKAGAASDLDGGLSDAGSDSEAEKRS